MPAESASTSPTAIPRPGPAPQPATPGHSLRLHRRSMAGRGGSADEARLHWRLPDCDFAHHGRRRFSGALEPARSGPRHLFRSGRRTPRAPSHSLGASGGLPLGRGQHAHHFCDSGYGLNIAFPLWNSNSLLGIFWGFLFFNRLRQAGWRRWAGVLGGALVMCVGATILAIASASQRPSAHSLNGGGLLSAWVFFGARCISPTARPI